MSRSQGKMVYMKIHEIKNYKFYTENTNTCPMSKNLNSQRFRHNSTLEPLTDALVISSFFKKFISHIERPVFEDSLDILVSHPPSYSSVMYYRSSITIGLCKAGEGPIHPFVRHTLREGKVLL